MASKTETLKNKIIEAIKKEDSSIVITALLISVVKKGSIFSSSMEVQISGRVDRESDVEKILTIAKGIAGDTPVVSTVRFKS